MTKAVRFKALATFFSEELGSQYVAGLLYTARPGDTELRALIGVDPAKPGPWRLDNLVELFDDGSPVAEIDGSDAPTAAPSLLDRLRAFFFGWTTFSLACWAVTHAAAVRTVLADTVVDLLDVGTTDATGDLQFRTSGDVAVATLNFSNPAFGSASGATATASTISSDTNAVGGTIAKAALRNRDNTDKVLCSVTATGGGGDITLSAVVIAAGQTVAVSSLTYTAPA